MAKRKIVHGKLSWMVVAVSIAAVFGYGFYESGIVPQHSFPDTTPSTGTAIKPTIACSVDGDCPTIECIKAPCPYYVCRESLCNIVLPSDNGTVNPYR